MPSAAISLYLILVIPSVYGERLKYSGGGMKMGNRSP